jgi:6-phosphogluconolactonase (cycloisomerase 2 family)
MAAAAATGVSLGGALPEIAAAQVSPSPSRVPMSKNKSMSDSVGGHLYIQTNEVKNAIIHYHRSANGALTELEHVATGGAGSGPISPIYNINRPNDFEGAGSVRLTADRRFLFATNGGDNSVSSFAVDKEGQLKLQDGKRTGNTQTGGAKSVAYAASSHMLYVVHTVGPDHVRLMSVDDQGNLTPRSEQYSVNTKDWPNRMPTMAVLSPNGKFLLVGTTFDEFPSRKNPDGSLILWIPHGENGALHVIASNAPDPDGIVVFRVGEGGTLGEPSFNDAGGASPFYLAFLHNRPDTLLIGYAVSNGVGMAGFDQDGRIRPGRIVHLDTSAGLPSELCWLSVSPNDRMVYTTNFGYSYVTSYRIEGNTLSIAKDPASARVRGDGTFRAIDGTVSSGPSDSWISPDGAYLYQIYGNASKLLGYATHADGSLSEITNVKIPYNSPQGLAGS